MSIYTNRDAQTFKAEKEIGRGGEGVVYAVAGRNDVVAKIYHSEQRTYSREAKLLSMISQPPLDYSQTFALPHISLAWPTDLLFEADAFAGFLMPRIERSPNLVALFNPLLRRQRFPQADGRFLYHTAQNLAVVLAALHSRSHVVGDLNQKNILVKANALVTLVDTDSFQIGDGKGHCYHCPVGVPDYTAPELQGQPLASINRQPYHDCFALSVLLFQLLMEGYHPFTGRPLTPALREREQLSLHCMQQGWFPYSNNSAVQPPPAAPPFTSLPPEIRRLFLQSFLVGYTDPTRRPTAETWARALGRAERNLVHCPQERSHWYSNHLQRCPFCAMKPKVAPAIQSKPRPIIQPTTTFRPPQGLMPAQGAIGVPSRATDLFKAMGIVVGLIVAVILILQGIWPALGWLFFLLRAPQIHTVIWPAVCRGAQWLVIGSRAVGRALWAMLRWLLPRMGQAARAMARYWFTAPTIAKELSVIAVLILFFMALHYLGGTSAIVSQAPPSPLVSPFVESPLALPTNR